MIIIIIDPSAFFNQLTMFIKQEKKKKRMELLKYELTLEPAALFKDECMCRPYK